jgi:hydrogenase maturation factor
MMSTEADERVLNPGKLPSALLSRLLRDYATTDPAVLVGPGVGRDAAALTIGGETLVVKSDPITFATENAASYLVNVNANDIACLGAIPRWLTVTALLPQGKTTPALVEAQVRELHQACARIGVTLIGGHTEVTHGLDRPILVGHMLGVARPEGILRPGGARPGDQLLLTKAIAIEGTALLARECPRELACALGTDVVKRAQQLLHDPGISVVRDADVVLQAGGITALHDPTEGGLAMGVRELALAAGCGATLDLGAVPVLPETRAVADHFGLEPCGMLASGALLAAASPAAVPSIMDACRAAGVPIARIGTVTEEADGIRWIRDGHLEELPEFNQDEVSRVLAAGCADSPTNDDTRGR